MTSLVRHLELCLTNTCGRGGGDWRTSQPACGETLRRQTSSAVICLKTDEKDDLIGEDDGVGKSRKMAHLINIHTLIARRVQSEENDHNFKHEFKLTDPISHPRKKKYVAHFVTPFVSLK